MDEIELLKSVGCPDWVIEHSKGVSRKAVEIARFVSVACCMISAAPKPVPLNMRL